MEPRGSMQMEAGRLIASRSRRLITSGGCRSRLSSIVDVEDSERAKRRVSGDLSLGSGIRTGQGDAGEEA